jgi:uncharacterized protein (DUF2141 family)
MFAGSALACEGQQSQTKLVIVVDNVKNDVGLLTAAVYPDDAARFLKFNGSLVTARTTPVAPSTQVCLWLPRPGGYAVAAYQDLNRNLKWDHEGLKVEPFGFSNNPHIVFSPPSLAATRFQVPAGETTIHIRLHHSVPS